MDGLVELVGGSFWMGAPEGDGYADDGEGPVHEVQLEPYSIAATTVTNAEFAAFCDDTGYLTLAERDRWSFVFAGLLPDDFAPTRGVSAAPWWRQVEGADWRHPCGPHTTIDDALDHPVVHVTWDDAVAFCRWSGTRLPTEAEWEFAARGGLDRQRFPWGDELEPGGRHLMNVFQGEFPGTNTVADGFAGTAPVRSFPPNGLGLYEVTGNVWEWCADWFAPDTYRRESAGGVRRHPSGPPGGTHRVMRGGSYLCHDSYCTRYRVGARSANTPDSAAGNIGFRVAR
jgi:formylglycine-generating enzyme required for sulfatase activity